MSRSRARLTIADACAVIGEAGFGAQPPGIGLELEWFVVDATGRPVTEIARIRAALDAGGALPRGSRVTFEPGAQLEVSTLPCPSGPAALDAAATDAAAVRSRLAAIDLACVAVGLDAGAPRPRVIDEPRYRAMAGYFARQGSAGARMMRNTASMQVNVAYAPDLDTHWDYGHDLAPVLAAVFAHSPLVAGHPSGWQSTRLATWAALDPARTRPVANARRARDAWIEYALDAPVMFVRRNGDCVVPEGILTLRSWIERGHRLGVADDDAVAYHLTTLFPPIRPRGWLELRTLDALPEPWWRVAAAVAITALTDAETRSFLTPVLAGAADRWLDAAWVGIHDPELAALGRAVFAASRSALERLGYDPELLERADEFRARYVDAGRSPADDLLESWSTTGALAPAPEPIPVPAR